MPFKVKTHLLQFYSSSTILFVVWFCIIVYAWNLETLSSNLYGIVFEVTEQSGDTLTLWMLRRWILPRNQSDTQFWQSNCFKNTFIVLLVFYSWYWYLNMLSSTSEFLWVRTRQGPTQLLEVIVVSRCPFNVCTLAVKESNNELPHFTCSCNLDYVLFNSFHFN